MLSPLNLLRSFCLGPPSPHLTHCSDDSDRAIGHSFAFRNAVEPAAAAEAARNANLQQLYALESALELMETAKDDFGKWIEGDVAFAAIRSRNPEPVRVLLRAANDDVSSVMA